MHVSRVLPLLLAAVATSTTEAVDTPCTDAKYADTYASVKTQLAACETASGVSPLELPLANKKKLLLCDACPELAALAKAKTLPTCTITQSDGESYTLRKQMTKLFNQCSGASDSGSDASTKESVSTTTTPAPSTITPTPTTTETPKTTTKAPAASKSSSSASNSTTPTANSKSSATASSVAGEADDGVTPSASASSRTTTSAPSSSSTNTSGASSSKNDATQQTSGNDKGSSLSVGVIAGVVVGVLVVVAVVVFIVVTKCRRKNDDVDKYDDATPDSSRELTINIPFHNAMHTVNLNSGTDNDSVMAREDKAGLSMTTPPVTQGHLWDDPLIVAARIPKDKVVATMLLSRGGFGEVYRGVYNGQQVAIKTLLPETRKDMREINLFLIEVKFMALLEHERIAQFVGVAWDSLTDLCVVTEYMEGGDLRDLLSLFEQAERPQGFDHDKVKIAMHVAHALTYLHSLQPKVLHRDLKSKNILLDTQMNAKLTDFGVSRERSDSTMTAGVGTSLWMAPEVMLGRRYDVKADIFSFGVVLSELDSHALPYSNAKMKISRSRRPVTDSAVLKLVSLGQLSVEFSANAPRELVNIAEACVAYNPKDRPSAADLLYMLHNVLRDLHMSVSF